MIRSYLSTSGSMISNTVERRLRSRFRCLPVLPGLPQGHREDRQSLSQDRGSHYRRAEASRMGYARPCRLSADGWVLGERAQVRRAWTALRK